MAARSAALEEAKIPRRVLRGSLQHWKKLRFPNEGLEGGAGWQPAAQQQGSRMRAWKEGAAWQPAALEEAKTPE